MLSYLLIIFKILFTGSSQSDIYQKLAISKNIDNSIVVQLNATTWAAKDRTYMMFDSTTSLASYLYSISPSTAVSDVEIYAAFRTTFTYLPPRVDIQIR